MLRAMFNEASRRLPGVYFVPAAAAAPAALPPLHEAAFVGFAPFGPLDRPVPVDSAAAYGAVFGGALALARSADGGRIDAHLRSAVLGFLANGGRRAHVVRVAGHQAKTASYTLRGLQAFRPGPAGTRLTPQAVRIEAAWPGAWANALQLALQLDLQPLPPAAFRVIAGDTLRWQSGPAPQALRVGDLLRVTFSSGRARLFPITAMASEAGSAGSGATIALRAGCVTATRLRNGQLLSTRLPPARPQRVERLRLIPWWREAGAAARSPLELAFNSGGPAYWGDALPLASSRAAGADWLAAALSSPAQPRQGSAGDEFAATRSAALFRSLAGDRHFAWDADGSAERALLGARLAPLDPGPATDDRPAVPALLFLPDALSPWSPDAADWIAADRLGDDDLAERGANAGDAFLDPELDRLLPPPHLPDPLLASAWQRMYVAGRRLRGVHALIDVAAAALLAAPDMVQPDWAPAAEPAGIDGFAPAGGPLAGGTTLTVSGHGFVADRTHLRLGGRPLERLRVIDAQTLVCRTPPAAAPGYAALELRLGSNDPAQPALRIEPGFAYHALAPTSDFSACAGAPELDRVSPAVGAAAGGSTVRLRGRHFEAPLQVRFGDLPARSLRIVSERLVVCVTPALPAGQTVDVVVGNCAGTATRAGGFLPRDSRPAPAPLPLIGDARDYSSQALLKVQRELLVICAARADAVAILGLPRHFRRRDCIAWRSALDAALGALTSGDALAAREDVSVASYGAVYHPWLKPAGDDQHSVPPDGAVCGSIAARELARQVWIAPARVALADVVGVDLLLADSDAADLSARQFNLLRGEAGEIVALTAHTLDSGRSLRQLSVRRLLILLRKWLLERGAEFTFATHDQAFREAVKVELDQLLGRLHALGAFAGSAADSAFRVVADASVNPPASVDAGRFIAIVQVAPSQPGEFILVRLERGGGGELRLSGA